MAQNVSDRLNTMQEMNGMSYQKKDLSLKKKRGDVEIDNRDGDRAKGNRQPQGQNAEDRS